MSPNRLSYILLGLSWKIFGPESAGKWAMFFVGFTWLLGIMLLAWRNSRPVSSAILATCFFFNTAVYWGFYSFEIGWPIFVLWIIVVQDVDRTSGPLYSATVFVVATLLYLSHILWFIAGMAYLATFVALYRVPLRRSVRTSAALLPIGILVLVWYPTFSESSMATPTVWASNPLERLLPGALTDAVLGGIYGPAEYLVLGAGLLWIGISVWQNRYDLKKMVDFPLLLSAALFFALFLFLPDRYMNTTRFAQRWAPQVMSALLLALPAPKIRNSLRNVLAVTVLASLCTFTAFTWSEFERKELSGLGPTLSALPSNPKVLGLNMVQHSRYIKGRPFIQVFAYSQVLKGGLLNFSFAEFPSSLVVFKNFVPDWTGGLELYPRLAAESDLNSFDYLIYGAPEDMQAKISANPRLVPLTEEGIWRLYKIKSKADSSDNPVAQ